MENSRLSYWQQFYSVRPLAAPLTPSQFAVFVANELPQLRTIVELGCGNGRDAEFFATLGFRVVALDASAAAVEVCRLRNAHHVEYLQFAVGESAMDVIQHLPDGGGEIALYARFFLHAITDEEERQFFELARSLVQIDSYIALEYRTKEDEAINKVFGDHFRRYIDHSELCERLQELGFEIVYEVQGRGLAKHKDEDARVGRCLAKRVH